MDSAVRGHHQFAVLGVGGVGVRAAELVDPDRHRVAVELDLQDVMGAGPFVEPVVLGGGDTVAVLDLVVDDGGVPDGEGAVEEEFAQECAGCRDRGLLVRCGIRSGRVG